MKCSIGLAVLVALVVSCLGCSQGIKEGAGVVFGAKGQFVAIQPMAATTEERPLVAYTRFELGTLTDDFGGKVPSDFLQLLRSSFAGELAKSRLPQSSEGKTLVIQGRILHYESEGLVGIAIGPMEEVLVRTQLIDQETGQVLATGNCIGRTTERVNIGVQKKAEGLAKAFISWIESRYPLPPE